MKKLLITGAFGVVGSNIVEVLSRDYPEIELSTVKYDDVPPFDDTFDFVIYAAGYGQPLRFMEDKLETLRIHCGEPLLMALRSLKKDGKFLYVSSSEVYSGARPPHKETDIGTTTPQHERACYIEGKRCGEATCMAYRDKGYDVKIARLALAYGVGTKKGDTRVVNQFIEGALTTNNIKLLDKGLSSRTYVYAEDAAQLLLKILFEGKDVVYNVGGDSTVSIKGLADIIADLTDSTVQTGKEGLKGAPQDVKLDMTHTLREFPMTFTPLREGLNRTIEYQKTLYA